MAGMTFLGPALHGHTEELHDSLTRRKGSFRQTVLGIYNVHQIGQGKIPVCVNKVVVKQNYRYLPEIAELLNALNATQFQFAFVHAMGNVGKFFEQIVPHKTTVASYIMRGIDVGVKAGKKVWVEAFPPCLLRGYEKYSSDPIIPSVELKELGKTVRYFENVRIEHAKIKFPRCRHCFYDHACEGPWMEYPEHYGNKEFQPVLKIVQKDAKD